MFWVLSASQTTNRSVASWTTRTGSVA